MRTQRENFEQWLETLNPRISPTSEVKSAWNGWQAALEAQPHAWVVVDDDGMPQYVAGWPEACHEHINEMLASEYVEAKRWRVRRVAFLEN